MVGTTMETQNRTASRNDVGLVFEMDQISLKNALDVFRTSIEQNTVVFSAARDGVRIAALDASRIKLGVEYIDAKKCVKYSNIEEHAFGINLDDLKGALMHLKGNLRFSQKDEKVVVTGADGFTKTFKVVDEVVKVSIPSIDYRTGAVVDGKELYTAASIAADMADDISFVADGRRLIVSAKRDADTETEFPIKILNGGFNGQDGIKATYSSEEFLKLIKPIRKGSLMVRYIKTTENTEDGKTTESHEVAPVKINFKIGDEGKEDVKGFVMLAPRVQ